MESYSRQSSNEMMKVVVLYPENHQKSSKKTHENTIWGMVYSDGTNFFRPRPTGYIRRGLKRRQPNHHQSHLFGFLDGIDHGCIGHHL